MATTYPRIAPKRRSALPCAPVRRHGHLRQPRGGPAELRTGRALTAAGGLPDGSVLAAKADADPGTGDLSGERVKRPVAESLGRLGLDRVQLAYLHDPEYHLTFAGAMAPGGPGSACCPACPTRSPAPSSPGPGPPGRTAASSPCPSTRARTGDTTCPWTRAGSRTG